MSSKTMLPFDLNLNRTFPYQFNEEGKLTNIEGDIEAIAEKLLEAKRSKTTDSPVHQLVEGISFQKSLAHEKTDIFRDKVKYEKIIKDKLETIREHPVKAERLNLLQQYASTLTPIENQETGVLIDVLLSHRAIEAWPEMIEWIEQLPEYVFNTQMVQEQYAFALNRNSQRNKAIEVLDDLIKSNGANPETNGILGRVYKDYADDNEASKLKQEGFIKKSIDAYLAGYEADMRDAYPGINAVTLMFLTNDDRYKDYIHAVKLAVKLKMRKKEPDYWDHATLLELAIIEQNPTEAKENLINALADEIEDWMPKTTIKNLNKLKTAFTTQGKETAFIDEIIEALAN